MEKIEVLVSPEGEVKIQTSGFQGATSCKDATRLLEQALGQTTIDRPTAEAFQQPTATQVKARA